MVSSRQSRQLAEIAPATQPTAAGAVMVALMPLAQMLLLQRR